MADAAPRSPEMSPDSAPIVGVLPPTLGSPTDRRERRVQNGPRYDEMGEDDTDDELDDDQLTGEDAFGDENFGAQAQEEALADLVQATPSLLEGRPGSLLMGVFCTVVLSILLLLDVARELELIRTVRSTGLVESAYGGTTVLTESAVIAIFATLAAIGALLLASEALNGSMTGHIGLTIGIAVAIGAEVARMSNTAFTYEWSLRCLLFLGAGLALWLPSSTRYVKYRTVQRKVAVSLD